MLTPSGDEVKARSKLFVPYTRPDHDAHRWYGGTYEDVVVRTPNGWRISHRTVTGRWHSRPPIIRYPRAARPSSDPPPMRYRKSPTGIETGSNGR